MNLKNLTAQAFSFRSRFANIASKTFKGQRDLYKALGYSRELFVRDYRARYYRNPIANRVVKALPNATWRGGAEVWEDQDPNIDTPFELAFEDFAERLNYWDILRRADILAGIGRYSIILIGAPGELDQPLLSAGPDDIVYLQPFGEDDAVIERFQVDVKDPRFGLPEFYNVKRTNMTSATAINSASVGRRVHWTRCFHIVDSPLDDRIYGEPRLQCIWNTLDDFEKVQGGGSEAFWKRADQGIQFNLDDTQDMDEASKLDFQNQLLEYENGLRRYLLTRGLEVNTLGSDVSDFSPQVLSLMSIVSAATGIPQRVLLGSEQAKLAAKMDRGNWDDKVSDRRLAYAQPMVKTHVNFFVGLGALPAAKQEYEVRFPELKILDDEQRAVVATEWAGLNKPGQKPVVDRDEIRVRVLGLDPWNDVNDPAAGEAVVPSPGGAPNQPMNLQGKEGERWAHIHAAADRFRTEDSRGRRARLLREQARQKRAGERDQGEGS